MSTKPSPDWSIEHGSSADLDGVMTVMECAFDANFGEAWTRPQCAGILPMAGVHMAVARDANAQRPIGFSLYRVVADEAELLLIAVAPDSRGKGVGRGLVEGFVAHSYAEGARYLHLEVRDGNPAEDLYLRAKFKPIGRRANYYKGKDGGQFDAVTLVRSF